MIRLLQGDVGSGKTIVALMSILISLDNGYQTCLVAPTEILALQHFKNFQVNDFFQLNGGKFFFKRKLNIDVLATLHC